MVTSEPSNAIESTRAFLNGQKSPVTGLVQSFRNSSKYTLDRSTGEFVKKETGYLENQCFLYDQALSVIAYSVIGEFSSAERILANLQENFHIGKGDMIGLLNSYLANRYGEDGRLLIMGIDGDRMHAGPNLWVGLAAYHYSSLSGDNRYFSLCLEIIKWAIHKLNHQALPNGLKGGISMGYGWGPNWQNTFSTEHNLDYAALLAIVKSSYENPTFKTPIQQSALRLEEIELEEKGVIQWLKEVVYDSAGYFSAGFNEHGLDMTKALDTVTFSILGIGPKRLFSMGIDPSLLIRNTENILKATVDVKGQRVWGFDFTDPEGHSAKRPPVIWVEGSYQLALAYMQMSVYSEQEQRREEAKAYREKSQELACQLRLLTKLIGSQMSIPSYTSLQPAETEIQNTFRDEWEIQRGEGPAPVESVASAAWELFEARSFNPMSMKPFLQRK